MKYNIREIEEKDNKEVENVIRACLIEFGANHEGTAWADPNLGRFSEIYNTDGNKYLVAIDENGKIVGGVGIGKLDGIEDVCELQKMYCLPETRGTGISHKLMDMALEYAKKYYSKCYLETLSNIDDVGKITAHQLGRDCGDARGGHAHRSSRAVDRWAALRTAPSSACGDICPPPGHWPSPPPCGRAGSRRHRACR